MVLEKLNGQVCGVYRSYCDIDAFETKELLGMRKKFTKPPRIDIETLWANFSQENLISLFEDDPDFFELLYQSLQALDLEPVQKRDGSLDTNPVILRLHYTLGLRNSITLSSLDKLKKSRTNCWKQLCCVKKFYPEWLEARSTLGANLDQEVIRDSLLRLGSLSP